MSGMGRAVTHFALGDGSIRRRIDVTRYFTQHPGERATVEQVSRHTIGRVEQVRSLLEELAGVGWLRSGKSADRRIVYWRGGERA